MNTVHNEFDNAVLQSIAAGIRNGTDMLALNGRVAGADCADVLLASSPADADNYTMAISAHRWPGQPGVGPSSPAAPKASPIAAVKVAVDVFNTEVRVYAMWDTTRPFRTLTFRNHPGANLVHLGQRVWAAVCAAWATAEARQYMADGESGA